MSAKSNHTATALREAADQAVATWRELRDKAAALRAEYEAFCKAYPLPHGTYSGGRLARSSVILLEHITRQIPVEEAAERAAVAEREACLALDAAELADPGDEAARLRYLPTLREDLVVINAEIAAAEAAVIAARRRAAERVQAAQGGEVAVSARRAQAQMPWSSAFLTPGFGQSLLATVDQAIARGLPVRSFVASLANLRAEQKKVAFELEEERLEKERTAKQKARHAASEAFLDEQDRKRTQTRLAKERQEAIDEAARVERLAADHLARRAGRVA